jgi:excisionase family DNA binding protein
MLDKYYTTAELMEILKLSRQTVYNMAQNKILVPVKVGARNLYRETDIKRLLGEK